MNFKPCEYENKLNMPPSHKKRKENIIFLYMYIRIVCLGPNPEKKSIKNGFHYLFPFFFGIHKVIMVLTCFEGQRFQRNRILNLEVDYKFIIRMVEVLRNFKSRRDASH